MLSQLSRFAQDYDYSYDVTAASDSSGNMWVNIVIILVAVALVAFMFVTAWRVYTKAKQPGWAALIPIYNTYVMLKIVGRPWWWLLLMMIPIVDLVLAVIVANDLSKSFGKGVGFTLLLIFLPFIGYPILAWGKAEYLGPAGADGTSGLAPKATIPDTPYPIVKS